VYTTDEKRAGRPLTIACLILKLPALSSPHSANSYGAFIPVRN